MLCSVVFVDGGKVSPTGGWEGKGELVALVGATAPSARGVVVIGAGAVVIVIIAVSGVIVGGDGVVVIAGGGGTRRAGGGGGVVMVRVEYGWG